MESACTWSSVEVFAVGSREFYIDNFFSVIIYLHHARYFLFVCKKGNTRVIFLHHIHHTKLAGVPAFRLWPFFDFENFEISLRERERERERE